MNNTELYTMQPTSDTEVRKLGQVTSYELTPCAECLQANAPMTCARCKGDGFVLVEVKHG